MKCARLLVPVLFAACIALPSVEAQSRSNLINAQLDRLARTLVRSYRQLDPNLHGNAVAVVDFVDESAVSQRNRLGFAFAELLADYLVDNVPELRVVERDQLDRVLEEQELALSDLADAEGSLQIGRLTGADLLVLGSVFQLGANQQVTARVVDTQTAEVLVSEEILIPTQTFLQASEALLALNNSLALDCSLFFGSDHGACLVSATYTYAFSRGLSLGLALFYHHGIGAVDETMVVPGPPDEYRYFEIRPRQLGLELLLGYHLGQARPVSLLIQAGPLLARYWDETTLTSYTNLGTTYAGGQKLRIDAFMFGLVARLLVCIRLNNRVDLLAGGQVRWCPENSLMKEFSPVPVITEVHYLDDLELFGAAATVGVRVNF